MTGRGFAVISKDQPKTRMCFSHGAYESGLESLPCCDKSTGLGEKLGDEQGVYILCDKISSGKQSKNCFNRTPLVRNYI
jgi:hypothetical protein